MIVNNSLFSYPYKSIRQFLDNVAINLCFDQKILDDGSFIVLHSPGSDGKARFEICVITNSTRQQSRPGVDRLAAIHPIIRNEPKFRFATFDLRSIVPDPRNAHYELGNDSSRRIVYVIDREQDRQLYGVCLQLLSRRRLTV